METEPRIAARGLHGGGAGSFQGACAKPGSRRHFVSAAVAVAPSHFMFLARRERSFHQNKADFMGKLSKVFLEKPESAICLWSLYE
nr:uncharacterized protein LOC119619026 isoform X2 [Chlorocebus sabaeus]